MPLSYTISEAENLVGTRAAGTLTFDDLSFTGLRRTRRPESRTF